MLWGSQRQPTIISMKAAPAAMCNPELPLLRQSVYSRLAGYEDTNDAERLAQDPAMRVIVGWQGTDKQAASTNTMSRFETEV